MASLLVYNLLASAYSSASLLLANTSHDLAYSSQFTRFLALSDFTFLDVLATWLSTKSAFAYTFALASQFTGFLSSEYLAFLNTSARLTAFLLWWLYSAYSSQSTRLLVSYNFACFGWSAQVESCTSTAKAFYELANVTDSVCLLVSNHLAFLVDNALLCCSLLVASSALLSRTLLTLS